MIPSDVRKRHEAFWAREAYQRCCLELIAPNPEFPPWEEPIPPLEQQWTDMEYRVRAAEHEIASQLFLADAVPNIFVNFGPGCMASCIGGTHRWAEGTVWFENEPVITDWSCPPEPALDRNSEMYLLVQSLTERLLEAGKGRFYTSLTDIGGTLDIVASLRGTQELLVDLYEHPDEVLRYVEKLGTQWKIWFRELSELLLRRQGALVTWMSIYSEVAYYPLQCDFSAMISPDMFGRFVLPDLIRQTESMERSVYHLDGPGEIPHLEHLLQIPRLSAIQWTSGAGNPELTDEVWFDLYQRIQAAGKGLVLLGVNPDGVEHLLRHVSPKGLYLQCWTSDRKQADEILRIVDARGSE